MPLATRTLRALRALALRPSEGALALALPLALAPSVAFAQQAPAPSPPAPPPLPTPCPSAVPAAGAACAEPQQRCAYALPNRRTAQCTCGFTPPLGHGWSCTHHPRPRTRLPPGAVRGPLPPPELPA